MYIHHGHLEDENDSNSHISKECIEDIMKYGLLCDYYPEDHGEVQFLPNWEGEYADEPATVAIFKVKQLITNKL